jgi:hypothetical protein
LKQLLGKTPSASELTNCDPLRSAKGENFTFNGKLELVDEDAVYYPCGLIANSLFSDEISPFTCIDSLVEGVKCGGTEKTYTYQYSTDSIAWPGDNDRFLDTEYRKMDPALIPRKISPPPFWRTAFPDLRYGYNASNLPNINKMAKLQVWMRTAGLPTFRKLWGSNSKNFLPKGIWQVDINMSILNLKVDFDVNRFGGTKSIVISTTSILGGQNSFLGYAYIAVGTICFALGAAFLARHTFKPRKLGDHAYLSWNRAGPDHNPARGEVNYF